MSDNELERKKKKKEKKHRHEKEEEDEEVIEMRKRKKEKKKKRKKEKRLKEEEEDNSETSSREERKEKRKRYDSGDDACGEADETKKKKKRKAECDEAAPSSRSGGRDEVRSANAWEECDLGSDARRDKFLRLMGAAKDREVKGCFVIGEQEAVHTRAGANTAHLSEDMDRQYRRGIEQRYQKHGGLGFSEAQDRSSSSAALAGSSSVADLKRKYGNMFVKGSS